MKQFFTLLLLLIVSLFSFSQSNDKGTVKGKVVDSASNQILQDATVALLSLKDSSVLAHSITQKDGSFALSNLAFGNYVLQISYQGYLPFSKSISVNKNSPTITAGTIVLASEPANLGEVVVRSTAAMTVKGDTTEFNASRFITKPNANAEDLLKKIPGVEVDKDGGIKAQGEDVMRVMVDGKMFFGNDAKMATQNLPTDVIEKIQIIDAQSEQAAFSGFDDGVQEKVINIVTKKDRRKGYFGKGNLSVGNDGRYGANVNLNRFNGNRKIAFIGQANNTNQENYSISDILDIINSGGFGATNNGFGSFGNMGQSGIARTLRGGLNYNDVYGTKTSVSGNYRYNNVNNVSQSNRLRETFVAGDSSLFNNNVRYANSRNISNNFNFEIDHKIDSFNTLLIRPSFNKFRNNSYSETNSLLTRGKSVSQKDVRTVNNTLTEGTEFNNSLLYRHRFAKRGRTISVNYIFGSNNSHTDRTANNYTSNYSSSAARYDTILRVTDIDRESKNNKVRVSYTEPITVKSNLELSYEYDRNSSFSDQKTTSFNKHTREYDIVDTILSNSFKNMNVAQRATVNYRSQINKFWNYTIGMSLQNTEISSNNRTKNQFLSQSFYNFYPTATLQYRKNRSANFRFQYRGNTRQPSIFQLQDIVDNTNILNITRGNPMLRQEFSNNFNFRFNKINARKNTNFIVRVNGSTVSNKISNALIINTTQNKIIVDNIELEPFAQYVKPININGAYNVKGYINYGLPLKLIKSNINFSTDFAHSRDVNMVNNVKGFTRNYTIGEKVRLTTNMSERFDLNFSSSSIYNIARYSLRPEQNGNYFTQVVSVEPTYNTKSGWIFATDFDYTKTTGQAAGYNQSIPLWNASVSKLMFKKKQGELKVSVFDILNENKSITRNIEENYIEDVRTNVLQRYFLFSFIYNFRHFGS